jgi:hypothetical protein
MQGTYSRDDLVFVSVHLENINDPDEGRDKVRDKALKALQKLKADYTNVYLTDPQEVWEKKLEFGSVPITYVFNRDNKIEAKYTDAEKAQKGIDQLVPELIKRKPTAREGGL